MITLQTFIIAVVAILVISVVVHLKLRKPDNKVLQKNDEAMNNFRLSNEQILNLKVEDLCKMSNDELKKLVDYSGHRIVDAPEEEKDRWRKMFELASAALYGYL